MKVVFDTLKYMFKNIFMLTGFVIVPLLFAGFFSKFYNFATFFAGYANTVVRNFGTILGITFDLSFENIVYTALGFMLIIISLSALIGYIDYHFKSGVKSVKDINSFINNNIMITFVYSIIVLLLFMLFKFVASLAVFVFHVIFSGLNNVPNNFTYIFNLVVVIGLFVLVVFVMAYLMLAYPITINSGYTIRTSMSAASDLLNKKLGVMLWAIILPMVFVFPINMLGNLLNFSLVASVASTFLLMLYYPVVIYVAFFEFSFYKRNDVKKRLFR